MSEHAARRRIETPPRKHRRGAAPRSGGWTGHAQPAVLRSDAPTVVLGRAQPAALRSDAPTVVLVRPSPVDAGPGVDGWQVSGTDMPRPPGVAPADRSDAARQRALAELAWLLPTLLMLSVGLIRIGWPALWADELATSGMASVSWSQTWQVLHHTDATLGAYYVLMHVWVSLVGGSDVMLRLPSVLAMAASAGLTARLGTRLASPRVGLLSGLVFAVLPTTSRYAQEARPYALVVLAAVLCSLALVRVLDEPRVGRLLTYALATALLGLLHAIALLLIPAHALVVLAVRRSVMPRWLVAAGVGMLPALPALYLGSHQTAQVAWIGAPTSSSITAYPATLLGTAIGAGMILALAMYAVSTRHPAVLYTCWAIIPAVGLLVASQLTALWLPRYLLFTAPAWALLAGTALGRTRLVRGATAVALVAAVGVTAQMSVRKPDGHLQATREAATLIAAQMKPGDGIVYSSHDSGATVYGTSDRVGRDLVAHYIPADRRPADLLQVVPQRTGGRVSAVECANVARCLRNVRRIWVLRLGHQSDPLQDLGGTKGAVVGTRYYVSQVWYPHGLTVALALPKPTG
jgi:mannosyltransferase